MWKIKPFNYQTSPRSFTKTSPTTWPQTRPSNHPQKNWTFWVSNTIKYFFKFWKLCIEGGMGTMWWGNNWKFTSKCAPASPRIKNRTLMTFWLKFIEYCSFETIGMRSFKWLKACWVPRKPKFYKQLPKKAKKIWILVKGLLSPSKIKTKINLKSSIWIISSPAKVRKKTRRWIFLLLMNN